MKLNLISKSLLAAGAIIALATPVLAAGNANAVTASTAHGACVVHGKPNSVLGNVMLYDWNNSVCPAGTYPVSLGSTVVLPSAPAHVTKDLGGVSSVATGGGFVSNSTEVGTVTLKAGTYFISLNAKATPNGSATPVFPQFFVYNQVKNASFAGDLFNVGSGSLATGSTTLDSYFSGSGTVTLAADTTLHVYAFGYSPDKSAGSYTLDGLTVTAVAIP